MGKINILSETVCNRIAAGEVIDRPYSAVKEMIENSIDAGATEIEVAIERGGKDLIMVADNGGGIEKDDMQAAFLPHATSKISSLEDIYDIHTLGFRGEALATIASVAQVELVSSTGGEAWVVEGDGENVGRPHPAALDRGTRLTVRNLFFNTPVRRKFLKTDKKEEQDITSFVTRYILGEPDIAFRYFVDGKLTLQSYGGGLEEALAQVYGANYLPHCFKIDADRNDIRIHGFIGNQNFFKSNKSYQNVYLNGRCISNNVISTAISQAYAPYAMKRNYPVYTLFVDVPAAMVDVNVHPNKADVRFSDNQLVFGTVYKVISSVLDGTAKAAEFVVDSKVVPEIQSTFPQNSAKNAVYAADRTQQGKIYDKNFDDVAMPKFTSEGKVVSSSEAVAKKQPPAPVQAPTDKSAFVARGITLEQAAELERRSAPVLTRADINADKVYPPMEEITMTACGGIKPLPARAREMERQKAEQARILFESWKYKGELFNTYLIYEVEDDVYIIDQHAAHERLIFDALIARLDQRQEVPRQGMLVPYILDFNAEEAAFVAENLMLIRSMGFDIEPFGVTAYRVNEVPADMRDIDIKAFFEDLLADMDGLKSIKLSDMLRDRIAMTACKHAVKGGMQLTDAERDRLIAMLKGDVGLKCPHGRPVCVKLTKSQIEKMFKRIV